MALFHRRRWSPDDVPNLTFRAGGTRVDIGSLGGEDHRQAFAFIFGKLLADNQLALASYTFTSIVAEKPVTAVMPPVRITELGAQATALALALYDSHNEEVLLHLTSPTGHGELGVRFDDPEFWLRVTAV